jgi:hypothetical protein
MVEGMSGLTVSTAERRATLGDRVLHDIALHLQVRGDVDRAVGDQQQPVVAWNIHDKGMADPARSAQTRLFGNDDPHQLIGMQAALHEDFQLARAYQ